MLWRSLQLGTRRQSHARRGNPWIDTAYDPRVARPCDDFASAGERHKGVRVLRTLIEDFGGEATSSSLSRRSTSQFRPLGRIEASSRIQIRAILDQLETCGALTLESLDENEVIARITSAGASLAYAGTAFEVP